jgi:VIT1/CCC1 family predicted Fe2+/Mn2+ transporter
MTSADLTAGPHEDEPHGDHASKLNWLRAAVLGANDGIVSVAGLVVGVAASTQNDPKAVAMAAVAGVAAGALSMAAGEYVSVSTQRDTEAALIAKETRELEEEPEEELAELAAIYQGKGLSPELAMDVAVQLTAHDALGAHAEAELGIDPNNLANPWHAAWASMAAFTVGALLPVAAILLSPPSIAFYVTLAAVAWALGGTGHLSAKLGGAAVVPAIARNIGGGMFAMIVTHLIGLAVGTQIG